MGVQKFQGGGGGGGGRGFHPLAHGLKRKKNAKWEYNQEKTRKQN